MKSMLLIAVVACIVVIAASCTKRDYTCVCYYTDSYGSDIKNETTVRGSSKQARNACNAHGSNLKAFVNTDVPCFIR